MPASTTSNTYDAIVVGARCAGSPTAMLLARQGHRVLVVDRAAFPSDTLSTHVVHPTGVAALRRWGVLDRVVASGCPPIDRYAFDFGPFTIAGTPQSVGGGSTAYAPRRTVLDTVLVDAAAEAGAEIREQFTVDEVIVEDGAVVGIRGHGEGGSSVVERARVVIGADGRNSMVARAVEPETYVSQDPLQWSYYTYWEHLPTDGMETTIRPDRGWAAVPTNDGLTLVVLGWPAAEAAAYKADPEGNYLATLGLSPAFAERVAGATRVDRFHGGWVPNFVRTPHGPGWALVGDAAYCKDPITAQGISDAFADAERTAAALHAAWCGDTTYDAAMTAAQEARDAHSLPMFHFTAQLATLAPPPPDFGELLFGLSRSQAGMDAFVSMYTGVISQDEFFAGAAAAAT